MSDLEDWMRGRIKRLSAGDPAARATLARLRAPNATLADPRLAALFEGLPLSDRELAHPAVESDSEAAALAALRLYSSSVQRHAGQSDMAWSRAAALLASKGDNGAARGYTRVMRATTWNGLTRALRSLTALMAARGMGCDFARLAADLRQWRNLERRDAVRMAWARSWAYPPKKKETNK